MIAADARTHDGTEPRPWWETRVFVAAMILLAAVPLLYPQVPPLVDLPGHMARYRVELDGAQSPSLSQYYSFRWGLMGNLGVDLLIWPLGKLLGLEPAVKLITIAIPMLTVAGMLWVAREVHHRLPPTVAFALPFAYGHHFLFGFVNYALSAALALLAFGLWLRLGRLGQFRRRAILFVPISFAVWLCHVFGWGLLGLLAFSAEAVRQHDEGRRWWRAAIGGAVHASVMALPLVLMIAWRGESGGITAHWFHWKNKWLWLRMSLRDRWEWFDLASMAVPAALILFAGVHRRLTFSRMLSFTALMLSIAFVLLPFTIFGSAYADMRMAPFAVAVLLLAIRFRTETDLRLAKRLAVLATAFLLVRTAAVTASLAMAADEQRQMLQALDHVPRGARVLFLTGAPCGPNAWPLPRNNHLGGYTVVRREGFSNNHWTNPGSHLLTVTHASAGAFRYDPSQIAKGGACAHSPLGIDHKLASFPRPAFDFLWMIDTPRFQPILLGDARSVFRAPGMQLYRLSAGAGPRADLPRTAAAPGRPDAVPPRTAVPASR